MPVESAEVQVLSYRYLRVAIVALLFALAAAVFYQTSTQGFLLQSVSAYYYTPAQAVFVGALIGLGVCMIALQGLTAAEDMFLNLGGMFAIVVAIVPTARGGDFASAVQACRQGAGTLTQRAAPRAIDCPTVLALQDAARANVENNMAALLAVGGVLLILAAILLVGGKLKRTARRHGWILAGFIAALVIWIAGLIALAVSVSWLADHAHGIAGIGLLLMVVLVAGANARRRGATLSIKGIAPSPWAGAYSLAAIGIVAGTVILVVLWQLNEISLFWVEILAAFLFIVFWLIQTIELERLAKADPSGRGLDDDLPAARTAAQLRPDLGVHRHRDLRSQDLPAPGGGDRPVSRRQSGHGRCTVPVTLPRGAAHAGR